MNTLTPGRFVLCLGAALWSFALAGEDGLSNQLGNHLSPYLAMHGNDPVHWQQWSAATVQKARALDRPIFISSGYFSCHWCHVMQRESFRDPEVAAFLNRYFVPVKIDRELDPALDAHLIEFVERVRGHSGWPLNVFLTPAGYPLLGLTYVPRERFRLLLDQLRQQWQQNAPRLRRAARDATVEWRQQDDTNEDEPVSGASLVTRFIEQAVRLGDELGGGFGQQNKFPMVPQLRTLLSLRRQGKAAELDDFIRLTLDRMADQGLHDNLEGGFFRYVTDPAWQVPHYEKMLYDNAQLAVLYLEAGALYGSADYRAVGLGTVDFMVREMWSDRGGLIGSFSAVDSQGREGFYYLWTSGELEKLLSPVEYRAVRSAWLGSHPADSEYGYLPRWQADRETVAAGLGWSGARLGKVLAAAQRKMLATRAARERLADDKILAAWNGLALSALAQAFMVSGDPEYARKAAQLSGYLTTGLRDGDRLLRARAGATAMAPATLEDYALVAQGLWDWSEAAVERQAQLRALAGKLLQEAWHRYFSDGRWRLDDAPLVPMLDGKLALDDGFLPSASAVISRLSAQHPALLRDAAIQQQLLDHLRLVRSRLADAIFWYASYVELLPDAPR
ncbi:MAG: thioredoxin domain-containing protein [Thiogranum sp.]